MLIGVGLLGGEGWDRGTLIMQGVGAVILIGLAVWVSTRASFSLPMGRMIRGDRELQVLAALVICFGLALISGLLELSPALGAFVAGMVIHAARETRWVDLSLHGFRVIFIAFFFLSVGMLIDVNFLMDQWWMVALMVVVAVFANTFINAGMLRLFGRSWPEALYAGALLSQIGEFSFVLATVGWTVGLLTEVVYQGAVSVIAISLVLSPAWIGLVKWRLRRRYGWQTAQLHEPPAPAVEEAAEQPAEEAPEQPVEEVGAAELVEPAEPVQPDETVDDAAEPIEEIPAPGTLETHEPEPPETLEPAPGPEPERSPEPKPR
jgi:Kef-type K+ transport system membrane component KefB